MNDPLLKIYAQTPPDDFAMILVTQLALCAVEKQSGCYGCQFNKPGRKCSVLLAAAETISDLICEKKREPTVRQMLVAMNELANIRNREVVIAAYPADPLMVDEQLKDVAQYFGLPYEEE